MNEVSITLPDGRHWTPRFLVSINQEKCIGCGRCFKVCGRGVLALVGLDDSGNLVPVDDDDDEYEKKVMSIADEKACIGCEACGRVCPKKCQTYETLKV